MAIVCFLGLIARAEPLDERMDTHWRLASALETEVIHGNLEVVRQTATRLSALPTDGFGIALEEPLEHLRTEATTLAAATTLDKATVGVARVAAACGACHVQLSAGPPIRLKAWTPVGAEENAEMAAHQEAMDWMWLGMIGPSEDAWRRGTRGLRKSAPDERVHEAAERAESTDRPDRPAVYAELLQACAGLPRQHPEPMKITFHGAAGTVTGSKYLLDAGDARVLVDCGLFQGLKQLRLQNWDAPPFDLASLDAVVLTHAHVDHSGSLPILVRRGWTGPIWCTPGTADLLRLLLPDAAYLQEEDARFANRRGFSKHRPALPLFDRADAEAALSLVRTVPYGEAFAPARGVQARFRRAGHIVGAARVEIDGRHVFSGDVGRPNDLLLLPPDPLDTAETLVVESTYGGRRHDRSDPADTLARLLRPTLERGGVVLIPSFAVGRAQEVMHLLATLKADGRLPDVPVFLDSPMAIHAAQIYTDHPEDHRLSPAACRALSAAATSVATSEESRALNDRDGPFIVLAGSGMASGGRILHHLVHRAEDPRNAVLLVGFQAGGTRGRAILSGAEHIRIHGRYVDIKAERLHMDSLSAHADEDELVAWLTTLRTKPRRVFLTHGEPTAADALRVRLKHTFGWDAEIPVQGQEAEL